MNCTHCHKNTDETFLIDNDFQGLGVIQKDQEDVEAIIFPLSCRS
jgi:hypothetical protein